MADTPRVTADPFVASSARMYDYYLGGKDNFAADRAAAERIVAIDPDIPRTAQANRRFLARAVRYLADQGITQFIDLGSGIPTAPNVHETVRAVHPDARVVYVDNDPVVAVYNKALNAKHDGIVAIDADIREPDAIAADPAVRRTIDFTRPVGVLLVSLLHFFDETDATRILSSVRSWMVPGSHLALSVATAEGATAEDAEAAQDIYAGSGIRIVLRDPATVRGYFDGYDLVDPGVVRVQEWHADEPRAHGAVLAGVGRLP